MPRVLAEVLAGSERLRAVIWLDREGPLVVNRVSNRATRNGGPVAEQF